MKNEYDIRGTAMRRRLIERESSRSDTESHGRMSALTQILLMAVGLPALVFLGVVFADSLTELHSIAALMSLAGGR